MTGFFHGSLIDDNEISTERSRFGRYRWWLLLPALILNVLSSWSFVRSIGAAAVYSAWGPIDSATPLKMIPELTDASHRASIFFWSAVALTTFASLFVVPAIRLNSLSSKRLRLVARYVVALFVSVVVAGVLVWIMGELKLG